MNQVDNFLSKIDSLHKLHHEHPLELVDLIPNYPMYKEYEEREDDEDDDDDTKWDFCSPCNLCGKEVNLYQRYYYKCTVNSCNYLLHKWCSDLGRTSTISLRSHRRRCVDGTLTLSRANFLLVNNVCNNCFAHIKHIRFYKCSNCFFVADVKCAIASVENRIIYHPSHPHPLVSATDEPILYRCDACGEKHVGKLYHCTTCFTFSVQSDCLFLSKKKLTTFNIHPLFLSYSFPLEHQRSELFPNCRICGQDFVNNTNLWIYKCEKCRYYAHMDCIKSIRDQFISEPGKDCEEGDHPNILKLPFWDQTNSIQKHLFFKEASTCKTSDLLITHNCHPHPLHLINTQPTSDITNQTSRACHNPRKKVELLCDGCVRPIMSMPFFQCTDQSCSFVVHEWCTRLPPELKDHYGHPQHPLTLLPKVPGDERFGVFECCVCMFPCNGFAYGCGICEYYIDVTCGFMPEIITHEAHVNHLFRRVGHLRYDTYCLACLQYISSSFSYKCRTCKDVGLHLECALLLPKKIMHKIDKHPMKLSYMPIENHKSEYFCEICEEKFDPKKWFYHCTNECAQSVHSACAPLILGSERDTSTFGRGVYVYVNIKFGSVNHNIAGHSHSLLFAQGINDDGRCVKCEESVRYDMVFKCLSCNFVIHCGCVFNWLWIQQIN